VSPIGEKDPEELSAEGLFHHAAAARVVTLWMITPVLSLVRSYGVFSLLG
jgi:PiT family inorganic phosphate transporter